MVDKNKEVTQLAERIDSQSAVALTDKQKLSLYKKSQKSGYPIDILEEVYSRGIESWTEETNKTPEQYAFGRVNSFIAGGKAMELDEDLLNESTEALKKKSASSGISTAILRQVYKRGIAAWRTGHRPGTTPQQWGMARVNSFITGGKTRRTADKDLWAKHKGKAVKEEFELEEMADKYKTGDAKTDAKRKTHFEKGKKMDDNNPNAYRDAPGDADARSRGMPESQYTKKYREMYNEQATGPLVLTNPVTPGQPQPLVLSPGARVDNARSPFTRSLPRSVPGSSVVLPDVKSTIQGTTTGATRAAPTSSVSNRQLQAALERGRRAMNINIAQPRASLASRFLSAAGKFAGRAALPIALVNPDDLGDGTFSGNTGIDASTPEGYAAREAEIRRQQQAGLAAWDNPVTTTPETRTTSGGRNRTRIKEEVANAEAISKNPNDPASRFMGSDELVAIYKEQTPGQSATCKAVKDVVREELESRAFNEEALSIRQQKAAAIALKHKKEGTKPEAGTASASMMDMSVSELEKFAKTKHKGLPERVDEITLPRSDNSPSLTSQTREYVTNSQIAGHGRTGSGESDRERRINDIIRSPATPDEIERDNAVSGRRVGPDGRVTFDGKPNPSRTGGGLEGRVGLDNPFTTNDVSDTPRTLRQRRRDLGMSDSGDIRARPSERKDTEDPRGFREETLEEATYKGKTVKLNKPFRTPGGPKKFAVYVDNGDGKAKIVRFGDPNMSIKKDQPNRKKSYCARSSGQGNLNNKGSANYWSRKMWDC